ncbi:hypothetical protein [Brevundimonas nasdae]|jgi:hypothetical protein
MGGRSDAGSVGGQPFLAAPEIDPRGSYVWWAAGDDDDAEEVSEDEGV